jgi:hypothetical protein
LLFASGISSSSSPFRGCIGSVFQSHLQTQIDTYFYRCRTIYIINIIDIDLMCFKPSTNCFRKSLSRIIYNVYDIPIATHPEMCLVMEMIEALRMFILRLYVHVLVKKIKMLTTCFRKHLRLPLYIEFVLKKKKLSTFQIRIFIKLMIFNFIWFAEKWRIV